VTELQAELAKARATQQARTSTAEQISVDNDPGVAFLFTSFGPDSNFGATAFGVTPEGLMVTNRHNVRRNGQKASAVTVVFSNSKRHISAHIVKVSDDSSADLATIQLDGGGRFPTVSGVSRDGEVAQGASVVTLGFPASLDLPMDGDVMKSSLITGTIGKKTPDFLQLDSWATKGASGSPVFDAHGTVVGVIMGSPLDSKGAIVLAVPSAKVVAFLGDAGRAIVKP
jgi:S1-C subfamily serine protease